jgi:SOS-response transcriptional repressor LexA
MPDRKRQRRYEPFMVLAYIVSYKQTHQGRSPSERRIQKGLGISSPSVVHNLLQRLKRAEFLIITTYGRGCAADLTPTETGQRAVQIWKEDNSSTNQAEAPEE